MRPVQFCRFAKRTTRRQVLHLWSGAVVLIVGFTAPLLAQESTPRRRVLRDTPVVAPALFGGLRWRSVGPLRGGRVTAVTGIADQPHVFFMGTTGGGVWKTDDAGGHWTPLTDAFLDVGNIGAIDVADSDPNIIYVGTGSASIRGNSSVGRGMWKSTDAGATWQFIGLRETGAIGKVRVHPTDPNVVYVAAVGQPFARNAERGVFRTTNGGETWAHVLKLNDSTGVVTLMLSPDNPRELYAGAWRAERKPWTMMSGGPEGGVYKSTDGGDSWTKLGGGLPKGIVGKVGLAISEAAPHRVWALVEAEPNGGLYRSDNRGETWTLINSDRRLRGRHFYYTHLIAHPTDSGTVFVPNVPLLKSTDDGRTFTPVPVPHGDTHDLWINPLHPHIYGLADDGGTVVTVNDGRTFSSMYNQPTAELYDVVVDNQIPYRLYGSQQDNTAVSVLQRRLHNTLRPQQEWGYGAGCETGPVALHPDFPDTIWGGCYGGALNRYDVRNDTRVSVTVYPEATALAPSDMTNRWQWVAPLVVSPHEPRTLFQASQYLYRSRDGGDSWTRISPDLTTNDSTVQRWPGGPISRDHSGVEVFTTIFAVTPSPHDARTIWVGTDDGRMHITRDDGENWTDITPPKLPKYATVNRIDVSPHSAGRAYAAVQRYRMGDVAPYILRTDNFGASWVRLTDGQNGIPADHPVRVVREDQVQPGLLFAGTEFGVFVSFNNGTAWQPLQLNLPATPVTDLKVHRGDVAISTQGRSFWILDDIGPLRELSVEVQAENTPADSGVRLYTPRPAARGVVGEPLREVDLLRPDDLPFGALLHYVTATSTPTLTLEVRDGADTLVRGWSADSARAAAYGTRKLSAAPGFHRVVWDLRSVGPRRGVAFAGQGVKMPPGRYTVRLVTDAAADSSGGSASSARTVSLHVTGNPRDTSIALADYTAQYMLAVAVRDTMTAIHAVREDIAARRQALYSLRAQLDTMPANQQPAGRRDALDGAEHELADIDALLSSPLEGPSFGTPARLLSHYGVLYNTLVGDGGYGSGSADGRPVASRYQRQRDLDRDWTDVRVRYRAALARAITLIGN